MVNSNFFHHQQREKERYWVMYYPFLSYNLPYIHINFNIYVWLSGTIWLVNVTHFYVKLDFYVKCRSDIWPSILTISFNLQDFVVVYKFCIYLRLCLYLCTIYKISTMRIQLSHLFTTCNSNGAQVFTQLKTACHIYTAVVSQQIHFLQSCWAGMYILH